jgi:2-phospho-L-lactate guanylyltransferase
MTKLRPVWAVIPIKEVQDAKQRLSGRLSAADRRRLAQAMISDVLETVVQVEELAGVVVVTVDPEVTALAFRLGITVFCEGARDGHTGSVMAAAQRLAAEGKAMLTMPADIPLVAADDIRAVIAARKADRSFTIVPARDLQGSNAILISPADAVPVRFGDNSYFPHLDAAEAAGIEPSVVRRAGIELDVDTPDDFAALKDALLANTQATGKRTAAVVGEIVSMDRANGYLLACCT